jgi:protein involved in polysaccharide export with SLBB domain
VDRRRVYTTGSCLRRVILLSVLTLLAAGLPGRAQTLSPGRPTPTLVNPLISASSLLGSTNLASAISTIAGSHELNDSYKLRVGDKVSFQILQDRDVPLSLMVADSGELDIPYIGRVTAAGKTCKALAVEIKKQLDKEYYYNSTVVLALDQANKFLGRVYVLGQVRNQGPIDVGVGENLTAGKAILRAGGFADFANRKNVEVIRAEAKGKEKKVISLNMVDILEKGKTERDVVLEPDDMVIVHSRLINF